MYASTVRSQTQPQCHASQSPCSTKHGWKLRTEEHKFKASLGAMMRPYLRDNKQAGSDWGWGSIGQGLPKRPEALVLGSTIAPYKLV